LDIISSIETSCTCGPFRNYKYIYELLTAGLLHLQDGSIAWTVMLFITKPGVIAMILICLCARVYYSSEQAKAQKEIVEQCRDLLLWSTKDKEHLLSMLSEATKGEWQYNFHDTTVNPELYQPNLYRKGNEEDARGPPIEGQNLSSSYSGATIVPSSSSMPFNMGAVTDQSRYKKYE